MLYVRKSTCSRKKSVNRHTIPVKLVGDPSEMHVQTAYRQEKLTYIATGTAKSQAKKARQV